MQSRFLKLPQWEEGWLKFRIFIQCQQENGFLLLKIKEFTI